MKKLFLDDIRNVDEVFYYTNNKVYLEDGWDIVRNFDEFKEYIKINGIPNIISFDHDLADIHYTKQLKYNEYEEKTGYHCMYWLINYLLDNNIFKLPICYVHSMNPVGKKNIESLISTFKKIYEKRK